MAAKLILFFLLISAAFSTETKWCKCHGRKQEQIMKATEKKLKPTPQLISKNLLQLTEQYSEPRVSVKMKMVDKQWSKMETTGLLNVFPNERDVNVFRDMQTNEIFWKDEKNSFRTHQQNEIKDKFESCLEETEVGTCLFHFISRFGLVMSSKATRQFIKDILDFMSETVDVNAKDGGNYTPLMWAARFDAYDAVLKLIERNANMEEVNDNGWTALHFAAQHGSDLACRGLLEKGANANAQVDLAYDEGGVTPIMFAAYWGRDEVVKVLLHFNASTNLKNKLGGRALDFARASDSDSTPECTALIEEHERKEFLKKHRKKNCWFCSNKGHENLLSNKM